ncbi:MAG: CoA transferase, partial [Sciscionella sp.]
YEVYETADGGHVAVGAIEPQFYAELLRLLEVDPSEAPEWDRERWPELKQRFAALFGTRTRQDWSRLLERAEACATAVYGLGEVPQHPHLAARGTCIEVEGVVQPRPAPRFSRTPGSVTRPPRPAGSETDEAVAAWGVNDAERERLRTSAAIGPTE